MSLIVQKFGGSSVADKDKVMNVASIVADTYKKGNDVVVVVSAQGDTTDDLIAKYKEIDENASNREKDMLLAAGEQISISLLAMALHKLGCPAISLLGWQAGFATSSSHTTARIKKVDTTRLKAEIAKKQIVVVAGFQGLNKYDDITTLGRGGSDTSAVAIAAAMHADLCQIYTDVEGVYTADPRKVPTAQKLEEISYDEMLELASLGAQVLNNRSVELAKKFGIELEVLSSLTHKPGTIVKEKPKMEKILISGVAKDTDIARISVTNIPNEPGFAFKMFSLLSAKNINVDIILQSIGRNNTKDITFTVSKDNGQKAVELLENNYVNKYDGAQVLLDDSVAKVSIVGSGMESHPGVASHMFEALTDAQINISMISTSEIKISVLIDADYADKAVRVLHDKFFSEV